MIVSEKTDLPLVSFSITFLGGANQFEPADRRGVGGLAAAMLSEGTTTRDGEALSNALQLLGTNVAAGVSGETASIGFVSTTAKFAPTLDILADMLLHSTFPADALERLRAQRLVSLAQAKARPGAIAARVFPQVLYGPAHPYGQRMTEETVKAITRDDVVAFYQKLFKPGRALVTVVGALKPAEAKEVIDRALATWPRGGEKTDFSYPPVSPRQPTTIYLVDKKGAAQSTFAIGNPGPPRNTPDYYALDVMNTILGAQFQSRLNANIREEKGYSYGVGSDFAFGKGPGPFRTGGDIVSDKTDVALIEFIKELRGIGGARPVTDDELTTAKDAIVQGLPSMFASVSGINGAISELWVDGLPDDYYQQYGKAIAAVTKTTWCAWPGSTSTSTTSQSSSSEIGRPSRSRSRRRRSGRSWSWTWTGRGWTGSRLEAGGWGLEAGGLGAGGRSRSGWRLPAGPTARQAPAASLQPPALV